MNISRENILNAELSVNVLMQQRDKLVMDKKEYDLELSDLRTKLRTGGRLHPYKYQEICDRQSKIKKMVIDVEKSIIELNSAILKKNVFKDDLKLEYNNQKELGVKRELVILKDYYVNFASDRTRVSSMRAMGAEFAERLEKIIKTLP